jgi:hypothetical protein
MIKRNNQFQQPIAPAMGDRQVRFCRGGRIVTSSRPFTNSILAESHTSGGSFAWCSIQCGSITKSATTGVTRATTGLRIGPARLGQAALSQAGPPPGFTHALTQLRRTPRTEGFGERHARGLRFTPEFSAIFFGRGLQMPQTMGAIDIAPVGGGARGSLFGCVDDQDVDPGFTGHVGGHRAQ